MHQAGRQLKGCRDGWPTRHTFRATHLNSWLEILQGSPSWYLEGELRSVCSFCVAYLTLLYPACALPALPLVSRPVAAAQGAAHQIHDKVLQHGQQAPHREETARGLLRPSGAW